MKFHFYVIIILFVTLFLSGCNKTNYDEIPAQCESISTMETIEIENPFDSENDDEEIDNVSLNFGWGINTSNVSALTYSNNKLTVPIKVTNMGEKFSIGVYVFVNGIVQQYTSNVSDERKYIQSIDVPEESDVEYEVYIENIELSMKSEKNELAVLSVTNPEYTPNADELIGDNHTGAGLWPFDFKMNSEAIQTNFEIFSEYESHIFTDDEKTRFWIVPKDSGSTANFFLCPVNSSESPDWRYPVCENGEQKMKLYVYSENFGSCDYRVSFYKNNEIIKFNGDYDYLDISCKDNYMAVADVEFDEISEGDFLYCIAVPLGVDRGVKKTTTILFCDENSIPEYSNTGWYSPPAAEVVIDPNSDYKKADPDQMNNSMRSPIN